MARRRRLLRVLVDGVGADALVEALIPRLAAAPGGVGSAAPVRVRAQDFWRPAGERFERGREDAEHFRTGWLDDAALEREVLSRDDTYLPVLWDVASDRSARRAREPLPERAVVLVDGVMLLGRGLTADVTVHVSLSAAALERRGTPRWQLPAFAEYDRLVRPGDVCDVLVRAEDPARPAVRLSPARASG